MTERYQVIPRTLSFIFNEGKVLLIKGGDKKDWKGIYNPVGGHIEEGENVLEAAKREIREETGIEVDNIKLRGVVHAIGFYGTSVMMFVTLSTTDKSGVISSREGELVWVDPDKLEELNTFEDLKPILKHVLEMKDDEIFFGTSRFDGKDKLVSLDMKVA